MTIEAKVVSAASLYGKIKNFFLISFNCNFNITIILRDLNR